jgi:hypothetical protein
VEVHDSGAVPCSTLKYPEEKVAKISAHSQIEQYICLVPFDVVRFNRYRDFATEEWSPAESS